MSTELTWLIIAFLIVAIVYSVSIVADIWEATNEKRD